MFTQACEPTTRKGTGAHQIEREFEFGGPVVLAPSLFFFLRTVLALACLETGAELHSTTDAMLIFLLQQTTDQLRGFVKEIMHPDKHL